VEGEKEKIETILDWLKIGPSRANVENVKTTWSKFSGAFNGFEIR
jgi:acylphosphatase